jgi:glycosyltransferase involved in cell wall biosynthesis
VALRADPDRLDRSRSWGSGPPPEVSVAVSTFGRAGFLEDLLQRLRDQDLPADRFEVTIVDNGSADDTWDVLEAAVRRDDRLRLQVARVERNRAPAGGRNLAVALSRGEVIAFTDDDCLPAPGWLSSILREVRGGAAIVQGRTEPQPDGVRTSDWDRSVWVLGRSGLFETCNMAYRRVDLEALGGFDERSAVIGHRAARPFGEDVELGWRAEGLGGRYAFAGDALVHHRWLPGSYRAWLAERRQLANFPALARRVPGLRARFWHRIFLTRTSASFDLAVVGTLAAALTGRPLLLLAAGPWARQRWVDAGDRPGRGRAIRVAQLAVGDLASLGALAEGSLRHRRLLL